MRKIASMLSLLMLCALAYGQPLRTVTGVVKDERGDGVSFANVTESGTKNVVQADVAGLFSIKIGQNSTLIISASGFAATNFTPGVGFQTITLAGIVNMREVVVTALGIRRKAEEIGYSTATVRPDQITAGKAFNLAQSLSGKVSGLVISNTSASVNATPRIVLRGLRSLTGDNTALIVLDGVPVPANTINYLNPNDVERVDIMKGGQAATLFGSDGVNGAIIITTKKGNQKPELTLTHTYNVEKVAYLPRFNETFGSGSAYGSSREEDFEPIENQQYGDTYDGSMRPLGRILADGSYQLLPYSNIPGIRKKMWDDGVTNQSDLSYRAGDQNSTFYTSFQHVESHGVVLHDTYKRNAFRFNAGKTYGKFNLTFDATYTWDHSNRTNTDFYFFALNTASWVPFDQYRDWKNNKFGTLGGYYNDYYNSPWWQLDNVRFETKNNIFNGNIKLTFKPSPNWELSARGAIANTDAQTTTTNNNYTFSAFTKSFAYHVEHNNNYDRFLTGLGRFVSRTAVAGAMGESQSNGNRFNADVYAAWNKTFNDWSVKAIVGSSMQIRTAKSISASTNGLLIPELFNFSNSANGLYSASNSKSDQRKVSAYGDVTVGWKGMVYLHNVIRRDYSSVFSGPTYGFTDPSFTYWGTDVSIVITDIIPSLKGNVVESFKIRGGYNRNGNDNLDPYNLLATFGNASGYPYSGLIGVTQGNTIVSPTLEPERIKTAEVGFELSLFKNRVNLEGSYYHQVAEKQILNVGISSATGFSTYRLNAADVDNDGIEADFKAQVYKNKDWNINVNANYSWYKNIVNTLYGNTGLNSLIFQSSGLLSLNAELGQMFPYLKTTAWTRDPATGKVVIDPTDGWPIRDAAMKGQGTTTPKHVFGCGINVAWKQLTLIADAEYRGGHIIYSNIGQDMTFTGSSALTTMYNRDQFVWPNSVYWDGSKYVDNTNIAINQYAAIYQGFGDQSFSRGFAGVGEMYYASGAFWKLRDVSLTYDFPKSIMGHIKFIKGISLTAWGRNIATKRADDNWFTDPEFSNTAGNSQGINTSLNTPPTKQFGATFRAIF
ncbi:MAG TPA: SusC/RagA family TonB-linked outer membrane protein [Chitinophagaceae bacterium]|nr:SusC/RagA family TonB-linked outer membrane protein [Chitinophagaceae bacterium]